MFKNDNLYYDRRKSSYRRAGVPLAKVVGISELAQSVAAVLLQEPDHARARPARYFSDPELHDKVFTDKYDIKVYPVCARLRKRIDSFLLSKEADKGHRHNLLFYVMMAAPCLALRTIKARSERIVSLEAKTLITEDVLGDALTLVRAVYEAHGADDRAAKGAEMLSDLKARIRERFAKKRKNRGEDRLEPASA